MRLGSYAGGRGAAQEGSGTERRRRGPARWEQPLWLAPSTSPPRCWFGDAPREAQKIEALGLTGGVAHDFNNLLTVVTGSLELIIQDKSDSGDMRRLAESALRAAWRGQCFTERLLTFARRRITRPEIVNVNRLIRNPA